MLALLAMIMGLMLIFFSNQNIFFPCPCCCFVLVGSLGGQGEAELSYLLDYYANISLIFYEMPTAAYATLPLCQGAPTQCSFTRYLHLRALITQRQVLVAVASLSADASRASNPPEYEHEQMFYLYKEQPVLASAFAALVGQPCRHMLLIIYSWCNCVVVFCSISTVAIHKHTWIWTADSNRPTGRPTVNPFRIDIR
jgi:hypothetical protein